MSIDKIQKTVGDLGVAAYILMQGYPLAGRKDKSFVFNVTKEKLREFEDLKTAYGTLDNYKALSDTLVFNSSKFKPLFGSRANEAFQAKFKVVKNPNVVISDNDVKVNVINAINTYFDISNWDFGETFYFSELAAYVMTQVSPDAASIVLVPKSETQVFGSLYEIVCENDEIFVNAASVDDIEVIDSITAARLKATGTVITSDDVLNTGIQSSPTNTNIITEGNDY